MLVDTVVKGVVSLLLLSMLWFSFEVFSTLEVEIYEREKERERVEERETESCEFGRCRSDEEKAAYRAYLNEIRRLK